MASWETMTDIIAKKLTLQKLITDRETAHDAAQVNGKEAALQSLNESKQELAILLKDEETLQIALTMGAVSEQNNEDSSEDEEGEPGNAQFSFKLTRPEKFKPGGNFASFCLDFQEHIKLTNMKDPNLHIYFLSLLDTKTKNKLRKVNLSTSQCRKPSKFIPIYRRKLMPPHEAENLQMDFSELIQDRGESLEDFGTRVEDIASLAFAGDSGGHMLEACHTAFVKGLNDFELRIEMRKGKIRTFPEVVDEASRSAGIREAEKRRRAPAASETDLDLDVLQIQGNQSRKREDWKPESSRSQNQYHERDGSQDPRHNSQNYRRGIVTQGSYRRNNQQSRSYSTQQPNCRNCGQPNHLAKHCLKPLNY